MAELVLDDPDASAELHTLQLGVLVATRDDAADPSVAELAATAERRPGTDCLVRPYGRPGFPTKERAMTNRSRSRTLASATTAVVAATAMIALLSGPAGAGTKSATKPTVKVKTFQFRPATVEVKAGTKVVWKNLDAIEHTVTTDKGAPAAFDGTLAGQGKSFSTRLAAPGTYEYFCERHPSMKGTIVVR